jgi:hypothetical protein
LKFADDRPASTRGIAVIVREHLKQKEPEQGEYLMTTSIKGIVHGKVIELDQEPGLPDGQEVSVTLRLISPGMSPVPKASHDLPRWEGQVLGKLTREEIYDDRP